MGGREFDFYKFRSMHLDSEKGQPILSVTDQKHRTTALGYWLRKTSLDELPQLFNVLKGDMSLVGPRPERPFFHQKYQKKIPHWADRLIVRGGITGWAQLNGRAELTKFPLEKLDYDLYYIENWSILFDIKILYKTFFHVLLQKDVY
jgi:lipopolysaccharide/colanic/teichoic acid biosynthesis glycosyltransferase